jgi:hypothetical protein
VTTSVFSAFRPSHKKFPRTPACKWSQCHLAQHPAPRARRTGSQGCRQRQQTHVTKVCPALSPRPRSARGVREQLGQGRHLGPAGTGVERGGRKRGAGRKRGLLPFPAPRGAAPPPGRAATPQPARGARGQAGPPCGGPQRGERVLNKCLWRRRHGRRLPSARVLVRMHRAPGAEEAASAFASTAATATATAAGAAARVRTARGRISHAHAAAAGSQ